MALRGTVQEECLVQGGSVTISSPRRRGFLGGSGASVLGSVGLWVSSISVALGVSSGLPGGLREEIGSQVTCFAGDINPDIKYI